MEIVTGSREFDAIVLGRGPAGEVCAGRLTEVDLTVAPVEREPIGSDCAYHAWMPSRGPLRPRKAAA